MRGGSSFLTRRCARLACAAALAGCAAPGPPAQAPSSAPLGAVTTLAGQPLAVRDAIAGRVALVSLWATWCDACSKEIGPLNRLSAAVESRPDALVVGIAVGEPRPTVAAFVASRGIAYPQWVDEDFRFVDGLSQRDVPATLVFARDGSLAYRGGALDGAALAAFRRALGDAVR